MVKVFTITLPTGYAYCVGWCLRAIEIDSPSVAYANGYAVVSGYCPECGGNVARLYVEGLGSEITREYLAGLVSGEASTEHVHTAGVREWDFTYNEDDTERMAGRVYVWQALQRFTDSVDVQGSREDGRALWADILRVKAGASSFDVLCETLAREGQDMPSVAWLRDGESWVIGNGHHRIVASILLGMITIPIVMSERDYMCGEDSTNDEDRPIESDHTRYAWDLLCNVIPPATRDITHYGYCVMCNVHTHHSVSECAEYAQVNMPELV